MDLNTAVELAKKGNNDGYEYLYNLVKDKSFYVAKKFMKNIDASEDLLQECFVEMMSKNKLASLDDNNSFVSWFNQIVANKAKDYFKKSETKNTFFSFYEKEDGSNYIDTFEEVNINVIPEEALLKKIAPEERSKLVDELMTDLSDEQRYCIVAHYLQDISVKDIAGILNVSENTVKSRLFQGRKKIEKTGTEMKKRGVEFFGIIPFMLFLGLIKEDAMACEYTGATFANISSAAKVSATKTAANIGAKESIKKGVTIAGRTISTKVIAGVSAAVIVAGIGTGIGISQLNKNSNLPTTEKYYIDFYDTGNYVLFESGYSESIEAESGERRIHYITTYSADSTNNIEDYQYMSRCWLQDYAEDEQQHIYVRKYTDTYYISNGIVNDLKICKIDSNNNISNELNTSNDQTLEDYVSTTNYDFSDWVDITTFEDEPMSDEDAWDYSMEHQSEWKSLIDATDVPITIESEGTNNVETANINNSSEDSDTDLSDEVNDETESETETSENPDSSTSSSSIIGSYETSSNEDFAQIEFKTTTSGTWWFGDTYGTFNLVSGNTYFFQATGDSNTLMYEQLGEPIPDDMIYDYSNVNWKYTITQNSDGSINVDGMILYKY